MPSDYEKGWLAAMACIANYCDLPDCTDVSMVRDYAFYTRPTDEQEDIDTHP